MVAVRYHRVSTAEQADSGLGLDAQSAATAALCAFKGWEAMYTCDDTGTGADTDRAGLRHALQLLADGEAQVLVAAKMDRLSRSVADWLHLADRARREGWHIAIRDLDIDTSGPHGRLILTIMSALAQWEREVISLRTREALRAKRDAGHRLGRPPTLPADLRRDIRRRYATGRVSMAEIADQLAAEGIKPPQGNVWHLSTIRRICRGLVVRRGRLIAGDPDQINDPGA